MRADKIVLGVSLIILGILFLFANLHIIDWRFISGLWKLWPLILVLWGLDIILKEAPLIKTILFLLVVLGAFVLYFFRMNSQQDTYSKLRKSKEHVTIYSYHHTFFLD